MAEIDLGRVVGEKGEPGQQGEPGPKGNTGATGPQGPPGVDSTRTEEILEMLGGLGFGQDSEGKWGYIPPGADTVVPFSEGGSGNLGLAYEDAFFVTVSENESLVLSGELNIIQESVNV